MFLEIIPQFLNFVRVFSVSDVVKEALGMLDRSKLIRGVRRKDNYSDGKQYPTIVVILCLIIKLI